MIHIGRDVYGKILYREIPEILKWLTDPELAIMQEKSQQYLYKKSENAIKDILQCCLSKKG